MEAERHVNQSKQQIKLVLKFHLRSELSRLSSEESPLPGHWKVTR